MLAVVTLVDNIPTLRLARITLQMLNNMDLLNSLELHDLKTRNTIGCFVYVVLCE